MDEYLSAIKQLASQYLYEIDNKKYKLSFEIGTENKQPLIERLKK